jgi:hypothetical protein
MAAATLTAGSVSSAFPALTIDQRQRDRLDRLDRAWEAMADPATARPKILIAAPVDGLPAPEVQFADPDLMLACELAKLRNHLELEDDHVASVRVQFGTAQVAHAFGCPLEFPTNSLPAARAPALASAEEALALALPALTAGLYGRVAEWHQRWRARLPEGVRIQHPDIQSPFNTAHLVRGNDLLMDFFDAPEAVGALLDKVTDFLIGLVPELNRQIGSTGGYFDDWGCRWRGRARISNCSMHMIRPEFYQRFILPRDLRLMEAIGGGRIHYCGTHGRVIDWFASNPRVHGIDVDPGHHDFWDLARRLPAETVLVTTGTSADSPFVRRLLAGDWPAKRNLGVLVYVQSLEEGRQLLAALRAAMPG